MEHNAEASNQSSEPHISCTLLNAGALNLLRFVQRVESISEHVLLTLSSSTVCVDAQLSLGAPHLWMRGKFKGAATLAPERPERFLASLNPASSVSFLITTQNAHRVFASAIMRFGDIAFRAQRTDVFVNGLSVPLANHSSIGSSMGGLTVHASAQIDAPMSCNVRARVFDAFVTQLAAADATRADVWVTLESKRKFTSASFSKTTKPLSEPVALAALVLPAQREKDDELCSSRYSAALLRAAVECCCSDAFVSAADAMCALEFSSGGPLIVRTSNADSTRYFILGAQFNDKKQKEHQ
jgi:hypothetical protein